MQFTVPQFIEHEAKIIGPLTMRQFAFVGTAIVGIVILWFSIGKNNFLIFLLLAIILGLGAFALAFVKINEKSLPSILVSVFMFSVGPKIYLWKRKENPIKMIKMVREKPKEIEPGGAQSLKLADKSRLKNLAKELETR